MIHIEDIRTRTRNAKHSNEKIKSQERLIDEKIKDAADEGEFTCFVEMPDMLDAVKSLYKKEGYIVIEKHDLELKQIGYQIFWHGEGDDVPVVML